MTAEISINELWNNPSLKDYFFRKQSLNTLEQLFNLSKDWDKTAEAIEQIYGFLENFEEDLYNNPINEIIKDIGKELFKR